MSTTNTNNQRQTTLTEITNDLRSFDFQTFDPRKDKIKLMQLLQSINSRLGQLLQGYK